MIPFTTKRIGKHAIENILALIVVAHEKGIPMANIQKYIEQLPYVSQDGEITTVSERVLMDLRAHQGEHALLEMVDLLERLDCTKCVVLSGLEGMGKYVDDFNHDLGEKLATCATRIILIGKYASEMVLDGLEEKGFDMSLVEVVKSVKKAHALSQDEKHQEDVIVWYR